MEISIGLDVLEDSTEENGEKPESQPTESPPTLHDTPQSYLNYLRNTRMYRMGRTQPKRVERISDKLTELVLNGNYTFLRADWEQLTGTSEGITRDDLSLMQKLGLITCEAVGKCTECRTYHIPINDAGKEPDGETDTGTGDDTDDLLKAIQRMKESVHARERQSAAGLLDMLGLGKNEFTFAEWMERNPVPNKDVGFALLRVAMNYGFLEFGDGIYRFAQDMRTGPKCLHMPDKQREILLKLMEAFPDEKFTVRNASELTGIKYSTISYYLENFLQRGILRVTKATRNVNFYEFSSEVHGIYKAIETTDGTTAFQALPEQEKEIHNPMRGIADAG